MPDRKSTCFQSVNPILSVRDLPAVLGYYQRVLGFQVGWTWGELMTLASVCHDDVELNLSTMQPDKFGRSRIYIHITGIDEYGEAVAASGANISISLEDRAYGMRDFRLIDLDGNQSSFGEAITN